MLEKRFRSLGKIISSQYRETETLASTQKFLKEFEFEGENSRRSYYESFSHHFTHLIINRKN